MERRDMLFLEEWNRTHSCPPTYADAIRWADEHPAREHPRMYMCTDPRGPFSVGDICNAMFYNGTNRDAVDEFITRWGDGIIDLRDWKIEAGCYIFFAHAEPRVNIWREDIFVSHFKPTDVWE